MNYELFILEFRRNSGLVIAAPRYQNKLWFSNLNYQ